MAEVVSIHRVAERNGPAEGLAQAVVRTDHGIEGDWRSRGRTSRQLTVIEEEALVAAGERLGYHVPPGASRRQVVVRGVALNEMVGKTLELGDVRLEVTELCDPCDTMERTIGPGGRAALGNHGGICARVVQGGTVRVGDRVRVKETLAVG